jgi:THO complex subunit 5
METPQNNQSILPGSPGFNIADLVKRPHNVRLYKEVQNLKKLINELVDYQLAHPKIAKPATREEIDNDKRASQEIEKREKYIRAQLSIPPTTGQSTTHSFWVCTISNMRNSRCDRRYQLPRTTSTYSARPPIAFHLLICRSHKYMKLPLIPAEEYLEQFPDHKEYSEHDLMTARIEHEHQVRVRLEERRQEKLKQKQKLIAEVKKGKDDLTKLDAMVEKFIEAAEPIKKVLATE